MRSNIGPALSNPPERVGINASTNESMGFIGRQEDVAAMAVAQVESA
jgi:2-C-methyl-D-erythritol 2,4-cyclodiphosphate synthase